MKSAYRVGWVSDSATKAFLGTLILSNLNGVSWGLNGNTLTAAFALAGSGSNAHFQPDGGASSLQQANTRVSFRRIEVQRPISMTRVDVPFVLAIDSTADAATGNIVFTSGLVIYSRNGSTLSPIVGATGNTTHTWASNSANFSSVSGGRYASFPIATVLQPGVYYVALQLSTTNNSSIGTSTTQLGNTISMPIGSTYTGSGFQDFGALSNVSTSALVMFQGQCSVSLSATNQTYQMSHISMSGTANVAANFHVVARNI